MRSRLHGIHIGVRIDSNIFLSDYCLVFGFVCCCCFFVFLVCLFFHFKEATSHNGYMKHNTYERCLFIERGFLKFRFSPSGQKWVAGDGIDSSHPCMEDCHSTDVFQEVKDCLFLLSGHRSLHSDRGPKASQNSLSGMGHPSVAHYPGSTTSTPPWDMADFRQKEGQQVKGRRILSPSYESFWSIGKCQVYLGSANLSYTWDRAHGICLVEM